MATAKETAEEQLLRMIEGPGSPPAGRGPMRGFARASDHVRQRVRLFWQWAVSSQRQESDVLLWRLRLGERVLWLLLLVLGLYLLVDLLAPARRPRLPVSPGSSKELSETAAGGAETVDPRLQPVTAYQEAMVKRNPFALTLRNAGGAGGSGGEDAKNPLAGAISKLKVVGVNRGRVPEALVEDTEARRTYFLKVGDQINGLTVKSIDQRGVLVTHENEEAYLQ